MKTNRVLIQTVCALGLFAFSGSMAVASEAEKLELAARYMKISTETMDLDKIAKTSAAPIMQRIKSTQPELYAEKGEKLEKIAVSTMKSLLDDAMNGLDQVLVNTFTKEELQALLDFYSSDVGLSAMRKMPTYMAALQPRMLKALQSSVPALLRKLEQEGVKIN